MKIVILAGASSVHTIRWANGLSASGHDVFVISQHPVIDPLLPEVKVHLLKYRGIPGYFLMVPEVRRLLQEIKPDIVNAHYASGYGTTARLVGYHPWLLSVWGSDVYDFPYKSPLHNWLVKKNIRAADRVASTSHCMAEQTRSLTPEINDIAITPFGVELGQYENIEPLHKEPKDKIIIGTVKTMKPKYGIDTLIEAFAILTESLERNSGNNLPKLELRLVGGGEQSEQLKALADKLGISDKVHFIGQVPYTQVPDQLAEMDIYVALSRLDSESFGVAIIEAGAAGRPVVVTDVGGLPEVTVNGVSGIVVPRENPKAAAVALEKLVLNSHLRCAMGAAGKKHVTHNYSWDACIETMLEVYNECILKPGSNDE
ncbi:glycosyltransferase [Kluyvera cryocrescens]|uniref:glycosyltransferase n=1 Tax=Kluyvera cryocrescens TaxID=580 RepID=UPI002DC05B0D|nr:glycosyltransferase [Kluyvera cryocrescens]MEB6633158.1 glycosyltransferase [Kluyvera cryocrescens]